MSKEYAANQLLKGIFDDGSFTELNRLTEDCEVVTGYGCISGCPCYAFVQNTEINNGAMGKIQANKLMKLYDLAEKTFPSHTAVISVRVSTLLRLIPS